MFEVKSIWESIETKTDSNTNAVSFSDYFVSSQRMREAIFRVQADMCTPVQYTGGQGASGKLARWGSEGYFTGSPLMVQRRLALGTDGQAVQFAVTFSPTA